MPKLFDTSVSVTEVIDSCMANDRFATEDGANPAVKRLDLRRSAILNYIGINKHH